jgi:hypothetical protein
MKCPKCKGKKFVIYEYEPLHTIDNMRVILYNDGRKELNEIDNYLDDKLKAELKCTTCGNVVNAIGKINFNLE